MIARILVVFIIVRSSASSSLLSRGCSSSLLLRTFSSYLVLCDTMYLRRYYCAAAIIRYCDAVTRIVFIMIVRMLFLFISARSRAYSSLLLRDCSSSLLLCECSSYLVLRGHNYHMRYDCAAAIILYYYAPALRMYSCAVPRIFVFSLLL